MIDTDKYEGHEPAPWTYCPDSECILGPQNEETGSWPILVELPERAFLIDGEWMVSKRIPNAKPNQKGWEWVKLEDYGKSVWWGDRISVLDASHKLMADAPLLLEEVERLHDIEREWELLWSKLEDYPDICAELICFMESEEE